MRAERAAVSHSLGGTAVDARVCGQALAGVVAAVVPLLASVMHRALVYTHRCKGKQVG